jgi:hypothetical protein
MPLSKQWRDLDRSTVGSAPERYGVYELGSDGEVTEVGYGMLRDEVKTALSYGDGEQVRWEVTHSKDAAKRAAEDHRSRL